MIILDGKSVAQGIKNEVKNKVSKLKKNLFYLAFWLKATVQVKFM